jgi:hypothetical protein
MIQADVFVIYDDAQFNKEDFQHRNKIRIFHGWKWLTVQVDKKAMPINKIKIKNELETKGVKWSDAHFRDIKDNYRNTPYFPIYENELEAIYKIKHDWLIDLNMDLIHLLRRALYINTKLIFSSELGFTSRSTERLVEIVEAVGGDMYLSGPMGKDYLDLSLFENKGIKVKFQEFKHPVYKQQYDGFISNMSAIDVLFNAKNILNKDK